MPLKVSQYMTNGVRTIGKTIPIKTAWKQMIDHRVRHLPVLEAGKLVGIISDRDIRQIILLQGAENQTVADVMTSDPFCVLPDRSLAEVAEEMEKHHFGSTIVQEKDGKLVGIFTYEDGMRALAELLRLPASRGHGKAA